MVSFTQFLKHSIIHLMIEEWLKFLFPNYQRYQMITHFTYRLDLYCFRTDKEKHVYQDGMWHTEMRSAGRSKLKYIEW